MNRWEKLLKLFGNDRKKHSETKFLAGRYSPTSEMLRIFRIVMELMRGFRTFHFTGPAVTVFGSARFTETHPYYQRARQIGALLAKEGLTVITGGGPGIMEAANRGAKEAGGKSIGANISLPEEQLPNPHLTKLITFHYFFVRKVILVKYSCAFVVMPGGFGTMDELMESLTLMQTGKLYNFPIVLVGKDYWHGMLQWMQTTLLANGTIDEGDLERILVIDDPQELIDVIMSSNARLIRGRTPVYKEQDQARSSHGS